MSKSYKWILFAVAATIMALNYLTKDLSAYKQLSPADLSPVIVITAVVFLLKAGALSAILIALKKLWDRIQKQ